MGSVLLRVFDYYAPSCTQCGTTALQESIVMPANSSAALSSGHCVEATMTTQSSPFFGNGIVANVWVRFQQHLMASVTLPTCDGSTHTVPTKRNTKKGNNKKGNNRKAKKVNSRRPTKVGKKAKRTKSKTVKEGAKTTISVPTKKESKKNQN